MTIAILADTTQKNELLSREIPAGTEILWADTIRSLTIIEADAYFDLQFENNPERAQKLKQLQNKPIIINSVIHTCHQINPTFARINAWPTMLGRTTAEFAVATGTDPKIYSELFSQMNLNPLQVPDIPGFITPRIIAMVINEAFYSLGENISTREEIDTAMKLGTNYPYGPFEWADKIGLSNIRSLLSALQQSGSRYIIAPLLNEN